VKMGTRLGDRARNLTYATMPTCNLPNRSPAIPRPLSLEPAHIAAVRVPRRHLGRVGPADRLAGLGPGARRQLGREEDEQFGADAPAVAHGTRASVTGTAPGPHDEQLWNASCSPQSRSA
jgi:hypothetical protein